MTLAKKHTYSEFFGKENFFEEAFLPHTKKFKLLTHELSPCSSYPLQAFASSPKLPCINLDPNYDDFELFQVNKSRACRPRKPSWKEHEGATGGKVPLIEEGKEGLCVNEKTNSKVTPLIYVPRSPLRKRVERKQKWKTELLDKTLLKGTFKLNDLKESSDQLAEQLNYIEEIILESQSQPLQKLISLEEEELAEFPVVILDVADDSKSTNFKILTLIGIIGIEEGQQKPRIDLQISKESFTRLAPRRWLNDEIINAYAALISGQSGKRAYAFNSFFYEKLRMDPLSSTPSLIRGLKRRNTDLFSFKILLVPVNVTHHHWFLMALSFEDSVISIVDSIRGASSAQAAAPLAVFMDEYEKAAGVEARKRTWKVQLVRDMPQQGNGYDCGLCVCLNMKIISLAGSVDALNGAYHLSQEFSASQRKRIASELRNGSLLPSLVQ